MTLTVGQLREIIKTLPDDMSIAVEDDDGIAVPVAVLARLDPGVFWCDGRLSLPALMFSYSFAEGETLWKPA